MIKDVLGRKLHDGLSYDAIGCGLSIAKGVVARYASLAAAGGWTGRRWPGFKVPLPDRIEEVVGWTHHDEQRARTVRATWKRADIQANPELIEVPMVVG